MRLYSIHVPPAWVSDRAPLAIREGFSWWAFLFTFLWALSHRLWWPALAIFVGAMLLGTVMDLIGIDPFGQAAVSLAFAVWIGFEANDLRRRGLEKQGYAPEGVVAADSTEMAALHFMSRQAA